jgi:cytochrome P450
MKRLNTIYSMVGYDTTATSLSALLNLLIRHPNYMSALRNDVRGRYQSMGQMTADSLAKVPLLNACIQESLRLFPPANGKGTSRTATSLSLNEDVVIAGTTIPAGVNVSADMWTIQRSSAYWAEADQFRPERWIENGPSTTWAHDVRSSFAPFLLGPRVCIGRSVALQSMRMVIAKLVWSFDIEMAPGMKYDWERDVSSSYLWTGYKTMAKLSMAEQQREGQGFQFAKPSA